MTNTEIKKELYKQKPEANLRYIRKGVAYYYADLEQQRVDFEVPVNDMGDMIDLNEKPLCTIPRVMCWAVDNMELLKSQPDESVDLIYCDILYGTGRNFGDYQDLKPKRDIIESHYLPRLIEMKRVLKQNGSIYLQMDTRINHWMRILMDDVFGYDNFRNEISWAYDKWSNVSNCFQKTTMLFCFTPAKIARLMNRENLLTHQENEI